MSEKKTGLKPNQVIKIWNVGETGRTQTVRAKINGFLIPYEVETIKKTNARGELVFQVLAFSQEWEPSAFVFDNHKDLLDFKPNKNYPFEIDYQKYKVRCITVFEIEPVSSMASKQVMGVFKVL